MSGSSVRSFVVSEAEQRSADWFAARLGRLTGSRAGDMLATIKSGEAAKRRDYRTQLVLERLTGRMQEDGFVSPEMIRGVEMEPSALTAYMAKSGQHVTRTGFLQHTEHMAGCSLDGHIGDFDGIIEIKCPKSATHLRYVREPWEGLNDHKPQILHNLWITGARWCDFVSFDDRFPARYALVVIRYERAPIDILAYEKCALKFLAEVDDEMKGLAA